MVSHLPSDYDERSYLHDEFTQMTVSLQEKAARRRGECFMGISGGESHLEEVTLGTCLS
jgi:hypothetical protein